MNQLKDHEKRSNLRPSHAIDLSISKETLYNGVKFQYMLIRKRHLSLCMEVKPRVDDCIGSQNKLIIATEIKKFKMTSI